MRALPTTNANPPAAVAAARKAVVEADGVWIFSPEYNYSYPGVLKNLLDWLSRPLEPFPAESASVMVGKKVALSAAAGQSAGAGTLAMCFVKFLWAVSAFLLVRLSGCF